MHRFIIIYIYGHKNLEIKRREYKINTYNFKKIHGHITSASGLSCSAPSAVPRQALPALLSAGKADAPSSRGHAPHPRLPSVRGHRPLRPWPRSLTKVQIFISWASNDFSIFLISSIAILCSKIKINLAKNDYIDILCKSKFIFAAMKTLLECKLLMDRIPITIVSFLYIFQMLALISSIE